MAQPTQTIGTLTEAGVFRLAHDVARLFADQDHLPQLDRAAIEAALPAFLRQLGVHIARPVADCTGCGHFSPHTATAGCGAEVRDGERTKRCGCLARNDDDAHGDEFARHTCNPGRPGQPMPYGRKAPIGQCRRCDQLRAGAEAREAHPALRAAKKRRDDEAQTRAAMEDHFRPGGPHARGECGPVCTAFDY